MAMATIVSMDARDGHSIVAFPKDIAGSETRLSDELEPIVEKIEKSRTPAILVDLTAPEYISSLVVAAVVRLWKNIQGIDGRMAVVVRSDDHPVTDILRAAGLTKLWPVVTSHEEAIHELGLSSEAKAVERERKLSGLLAPIAVLIAAFLLSPFLAGEQSLAKSVIRYVILGLSGLSVVLGSVSAAREEDWKRWLSVGVILGGLVITGIAVWILWVRAWVYPPGREGGFKKEFPAAEAEDEDSDDAKPLTPVDFLRQSKAATGQTRMDAVAPDEKKTSPDEADSAKDTEDPTAKAGKETPGTNKQPGANE